MWRNELLALRRAPFDTGADSALVAYYASAELGCFLELGWPLPTNVIDLFAEHRVETNGQKLPCGSDLLGALAIRGLAHIDAGEKEVMRQLVMGQRQWAETERRSILEYCASDVAGLIALLPVMMANIDLPRAKLRGRFMASVAGMERNGIPIDAELHRKLVAYWEPIKQDLITEVNQAFERRGADCANPGSYRVGGADWQALQGKSEQCQANRHRRNGQQRWNDSRKAFRIFKSNCPGDFE
jgi:hypothetical protein